MRPGYPDGPGRTLVDNRHPSRETVPMKGHGSFRDRIARTLNTAYGDGLLSEHTLAQRLDVLCGSHVMVAT
jgi:hypothetical protein